jgi:DEAD/DEAH box helicase domain-containing protein
MYALDGTFVVPSPELYGERPHLTDRFDGGPDRLGAIGSLKPTDVLIINPNRVALRGPTQTIPIEHRVAPAGVPALWSFAELFRRAAALELDVDPRELEIGLQPYPTEGGLARRIFVADQLENGAGYASELGRREVLQRVFDRVFTRIGPSFSTSPHVDECDASCPDCLRSYDNRRLHPFLDWRLALDVAELACGRPLQVGRWLDSAERRAREFEAALGAEAIQLGPLWAAKEHSTGRVALFSHPLWRSDEAFWTDELIDAADLAVAQHRPTDTRAFDLWSLVRAPQNAHAWLIAE